MILRCTQKLLAVLGAGRVVDAVPDAEDWYANLLWFDRRKRLLLTHAATLFSVFEADVRAAALRRTHSLVTGLIERELQRWPAARNVREPARAGHDVGQDR